ncbi:hypothetical protein DPX16_23776 [Anabarilius grahami]|uniref:LINE-1 type transposase domain-containing protein 1 n=1 Tax=Anabarilius grahami TaxID=495550 RepID=A0A3N0XWK7_ANAGA|nr:hypothetical protein DPX16_23776 [Anabarilius grahami]
MEGAEGSSPSITAFVENMLREKLELEASLSLPIERAQRALTPRPSENAPPISIVVNFLSYRMKEEILRTAWRKKGFLWRVKRVNIDHDYAPDVIRKHKEYTEAKKLLKEKNIKIQTPFSAKLRVFFPDVIRVYNTAEEATKDLADRGIPTPGTLMDRIQSFTWCTAGQKAERGQTRDKPNYKEKLQSFRR